MHFHPWSRRQPSSEASPDDEVDWHAPTPQPSPPATPLHIEKKSIEGLSPGHAQEPSLPSGKLDIEHVQVRDDPRAWSSKRKNMVLFIIAFAAMASALAANIYFPAIDSLKADLNSSDTLITQSVAIYILFQGTIPLIWSPISELYGRKVVYLVSLTIFAACSLGAAFVKSMPVFIVLRIMQASGSSSVLSMGAATLADVFDTHERGTKVGFYYVSPLLGPSLGSLLGGALTEAGSWRTTFYFLTAYGFASVATFFFLPDTFRKERSLVWRAAMKRAVKHANSRSTGRSREHSRAPSASTSRRHSLEHNPSVPSHPPSPAVHKAAQLALPTAAPAAPASEADSAPAQKTIDGAGAAKVPVPVPSAITAADGAEIVIRPTLRDVNPFSAAGQVLKRFNSTAAILFSGLLFAVQYSVSYTAAISFAAPPYNYSAIKVGLVLLSFGVGNIIGSVGGGRYSDWVLNRLKAKNGGVGVPEMRIRSVVVAMIIMPPSLIAFGWVSHFGTAIYWPVICLFINGMAATWIYSSTLSYIIDANPGSASSAVACNSAARGTLGMIASEIALPLHNSIGDGWLYTMWAFVILGGQAIMLAICFKKLRGLETKEEEGDKATRV